MLENTLVFPFNDAEAAEALVSRHRDDLAAVIVEPVQRDTPPKPGFLEALREATERYGVLLIFDEVISFRLNPGGAQGLYGVTPDITTLGKIIGGGFPAGAYASTDEVITPPHHTAGSRRTQAHQARVFRHLQRASGDHGRWSRCDEGTATPGL